MYSPLFHPLSEKYLSDLPKTELLKQPDWKTTITGNLIYEFLRDLHIKLKFPLYNGTAKDDQEHLTKLGKLVGVMLTADDKELVEMTYNPV